ncbi:hypothetical protein ACVJGD_004390 [Bradyrhizobium sp. USDA 10063]
MFRVHWQFHLETANGQVHPQTDPDVEVGLSVSAIGASIMLYFAHQALAPSLFATSDSLVSGIKQRRKIFQDINFI